MILFPVKVVLFAIYTQLPTFVEGLEASREIFNLEVSKFSCHSLLNVWNVSVQISYVIFSLTETTDPIQAFELLNFSIIS